jgi:hypothetical protein
VIFIHDDDDDPETGVKNIAADDVEITMDVTLSKVAWYNIPFRDLFGTL